MDPNLLNLGLLSIPFYERHALDLFDEKEKTVMDQQAEIHEDHYKKVLEKSLIDSLKINPKPDIIKEVPKMKIKEHTKSNVTDSNQDWLDNILDI